MTARGAHPSTATIFKMRRAAAKPEKLAATRKWRHEVALRAAAATNAAISSKKHLITLAPVKFLKSSGESE